MAAPADVTSMALFCDFENIALGVADAKYEKFDIKKVLERLLLKGSIVVKKAYCDWERYRSFKAPMHEASFELIEIPHTRQAGKNSADIRMVVDALDLCYTKSHVGTFVIISGDSDFSPLVSKLRENDKTVIGVGVKNSTSDLLISNCDEFIFYDDLVREARRLAPTRRAAARGKPSIGRADAGNGKPEAGAARADRAGREEAGAGSRRHAAGAGAGAEKPAAEAATGAGTAVAGQAAAAPTASDAAAVAAAETLAAAAATKPRGRSRRGAAKTAEVAAAEPAAAAKTGGRSRRRATTPAVAAGDVLPTGTDEEGEVAQAVSAAPAGNGEQVEEQAAERAEERVDAERQAKAIDKVIATVEALVAERGDVDALWGSMIKQTLKRREPGFNESYFGYRSFNALLEDAQARGLVALTRDEKSGGYRVRLVATEA